MQTFEQLIFKFRKCRFKQEIFFLIGLLIQSDYYQRASFFNPVAINLFITARDLGFNKRPVPFKIIFNNMGCLSSLQQMKIVAKRGVGGF